MRIYLSFLILLAVNFSSYGQIQRNYAQELFNLLIEGRNFEAREFRWKHKDQIPPDLSLLYKMHMSVAFNQPDSTIIYFEKFFSNPNNGRNVAPFVSLYYSRLCQAYESKQQFDKSVVTIERQLAYLKANPYSLDPQSIKNDIQETEKKRFSLQQKLKFEPVRKLLRNGSITKLNLKKDALIRFDAKYNGHYIETNFDTGLTEFCIIEKALADEIGVKYRPNQDSIRIINGKPIRAVEGYIDRFELTGLKIMNMPVLVFIDQFNSNLPNNLNPDLRREIENGLLKSKQVVFGLPAMKMIGRFEFDWKLNTLVIPQTKEQKPIDEAANPNLMFVKDAVYLNMKINDTDFIGYLDLGSDHYLFLTYPYFFRSKCDYVKENSQTQPYIRAGFTGIQENTNRYKVDKPQITLGGKKIDTTRPQRETYILANLNNFDGEVGLNFFKNTFSKTVIDFNTMTVDCEY